MLRALAFRATCRRQTHGRALVEYIVRHAYEVGVGRMYAVSATQWFVEAVGFADATPAEAARGMAMLTKLVG